MTEFLLSGIAKIAVLGVFAQWLAWRFRLPSILLYLIFGFLAGAVFQLLNPDVLFGEFLSPIVELCVAIILFEGGLALNLQDFKRAGLAVRGLVTLGAAITCAASAVLAHTVLQLNLELSLLLGAIIVMSGPSVIIPLLAEFPLRRQLGAIVRWEGIVVEPIGVLLSVVAFSGVITYKSDVLPIQSIAEVVIIGSASGFLAAFLLLSLLRSRQVPDTLRNPISLMLMICAFTVANYFKTNSGLLAVTILGIILANQRLINVSKIIEFKETLRVILIPGLFIIFAARLDTAALDELNRGGFLFLALLILVIRPLSVFLSTVRSGLETREKIFLSFLAPRGLVPAALSSLFALDLLDNGFPESERLVPITFLVIIGTVAIYGLCSPLVGRLLGVSETSAHGILVLGAHDWAREIARSLQNAGFRVLMIDTNQYNILAARRDGLPARTGNVFLDHALDEVILDGFGCLLSLTSNNEVNTLACLHFSEIFGVHSVYQLGAEGPESDRRIMQKVLFGGRTFTDLDDRFSRGAVVRTINISMRTDLDDFQRMLESSVVPLFAITKGGDLLPFTADRTPDIAVGTKVVCLGDPKFLPVSEATPEGRVVPLYGEE